MHLGFIGGFLALTALDAVVTTKGAGGNLAGIAKTGASILDRIVNPAVPAIPNIANYQPGQPTGSTVTSALTAPARSVPAIVTPNTPTVANPLLHT